MGGHTEQPGLIQVDDVVKRLIQADVFRNRDHTRFFIAGAIADLGDDVAHVRRFQVLIFELQQRLSAVVNVDLPDDDPAGGWHLQDFKLCVEVIIGVLVVPVVQRAVGPGLT